MYATGTVHITTREYPTFGKDGKGSMMKNRRIARIFTHIEELLEYKEENAERMLESGRGVKKE
jgi:hypothetical protein